MQKCNPDLKVTDISAKLGEIWRDMTDEQKEPYVKKSAADRERYHKEQEVFKSKNVKPATTQEEGKTPTPAVNPPVQAVVTPNQWNVQMNENSTNPIYSRSYDIPNQSSSFTNISIPTGFGCELWIVDVIDSTCSVDFVPFLHYVC